MSGGQTGRARSEHFAAGSEVAAEGCSGTQKDANPGDGGHGTAPRIVRAFKHFAHAGFAHLAAVRRR